MDTPRDTLPSEIAIFPLGTVLFPGGVLPLRVFEARYVDMVRECLRLDLPFGVCRITQGNETGVPADHESLGCSARIVACNAEQPGLLHVRAVGGLRFRVLERRIDASRLIRAKVESVEADARLPVPEDASACVDLARRIVAELNERQDETGSPMVATPYDFESAGWVANRIAEILPLPPAARQTLMGMADPLERLATVDDWIRAQRG